MNGSALVAESPPTGPTEPANLSDRYAEILKPARVRERPLIAVPKVPTEVELQAHWFAGDFGRHFRATSGETVEIIQFGHWNHEAGPDFQQAAIRVDGGPVQQGAVELDLLDRNWELHGHAINPAFDNTVLHVFVERSSAEFFCRTSSYRNVPQLQLDLEALRESLPNELPLAHAGRCVAPLKNLETARVETLLQAAAQFRLRRKISRLRQRSEVHGRDETLFQALAEALGYKLNRLPFTLVAQRTSLTFLMRNSDDAEAVLFGVAGFLETMRFHETSKPTRSYLRQLWDRWWKYREQFGRLVLPRHSWKMSGARPLNHPHRRLGALAALIPRWNAFSRHVHSGGIPAAAQLLRDLDHEFWTTHYTLTANPSPTPCALIGDSRIADILANILYPIAIASRPELWREYEQLSAELSNQSLAVAAARLFADDPRGRSFLRSVVGQQGLLQIYEDFCLRDVSDCAQCPFPEQVRNWEV